MAPKCPLLLLKGKRVLINEAASECWAERKPFRWDVEKLLQKAARGVLGFGAQWGAGASSQGLGHRQVQLSRGAGRPDARSCLWLKGSSPLPPRLPPPAPAPYLHRAALAGATLLPQRLLPAGVSLAAEQWLSCPEAFLRGLPGLGWGSMPPALARGFLTTEPPQKSEDWICKALF